MFSNRKDKWIFIGFMITGLLMIVGVIMKLSGTQKWAIEAIKVPIYIFPVVLFIVHGWRKFGSLKKLGLFFIIPALIGFIAEYIGVKEGSFFGSYYYSQEKYLGIMICGVPPGIPIYWAIFIYMGYCISNSFLECMDKTLPSVKNKQWFIIPLLLLLDGMSVTALDIAMDPIMAARGNWVWVGGGPFYGVPIGNFVGWFIVTAFSMLLFRVFEYFKPSEKKEMEMDTPVRILPVLSYGFFCLAFAIGALKMKKPELAMIDLAVMMPFVIAALLCFSGREAPAGR